jgi:O-antigen/teichoic acid export membrane protein
MRLKDTANYNAARMFDNVRRVARQAAAYGTADVTFLVINVLLFPIFAHVVPASEYGAYGVLLGWEAVIKVVFRWGLEGAFLRLYFDQPDDAARRQLAGTIAIIMAAGNGALALGLIALSGPIDAEFLSPPPLRGAFVMLVANCFISGFFFLPMTLYRAREQAGRSAATIAARLILVLGLGLDVTGLVLADLIVSVLLTIALAGTYRGMLDLRFSPAHAREALRYGLPHVPFGLLHQVAAFADRFFLGVWLPPSRRAELGGYQIASTIASLLKLAPVAFQTAWMPFAFETFTRRADAPQLFARLATYWLAVLVFLTIGVMALSRSVIELALPATYVAAAGVVPILALGVAIQAASWLPTTSLNIAKATRSYPLIASISAVAALVANAALIPAFGLEGAAIGMAIGQAVQFVATIVFSQRAYRIPYETGRLGKILAVGILTWLAATAITFDRALWTLLARAAMIGLYPVGLFVVRLFSPAERADLKTLLPSVTRPRRPGGGAAPPGDEAIL